MKINFNEKISAIILAAGSSKRMGAINKLLHPYKNKPLILHIVENALASKLEKIVVVGGYEYKKLQTILEKKCQTIFNADYNQGLSSSIRAGLYGLQGKSAIMILPADMPLITSSAINKIIEKYQTLKNNKKIIVATNGKTLGHPVLFGENYFAKLKLLQGDKGGREIINNNKQHIILENIGKAAIFDCDTPDSFQN